MTTELNTLFTGDGVILTFNNGNDAGIIEPVFARSDRFKVVGYHHRYGLAGEFQFGPDRRTMEAAEYDALAWAADRVE